MSIKRYVATKDNTITNAFASNLITRGTGSNMGLSDISEVFSIYGQASTSSLEKSRVLTEFSTVKIQADRTAGTIPASGSVDFYLKLYNLLNLGWCLLHIPNFQSKIVPQKNAHQERLDLYKEVIISASDIIEEISD